MASIRGCLKKTMIQPELYNYTLATDNTKRTTAQSQWETVFSIHSRPAPEASTPAV